MDLNIYYQFLRYLADSTVPEDFSNDQIRRLKYQTRNLFVREGVLYKRNLKTPQRPLKIVKPSEVETILFCMYSDPLSGHFNITTIHVVKTIELSQTQLKFE